MNKYLVARRDKVKITKYLSLVQLVLEVTLQSGGRLGSAESMEKGLGLKRPKTRKWQGSSVLKKASDMLFHTLRLTILKIGKDPSVLNEIAFFFKLGPLIPNFL